MPMNNKGVSTITVDLGIVLARLPVVESYKRPKISMELAELPRPKTLRILIKHLGIPERYISFITINGEKKDWDTPVRAGEHIILFPYIVGG